MSINNILSDLISWLGEHKDTKFLEVPYTSPTASGDIKRIKIDNPFFVEPKKKITLYRFTYSFGSDIIYQSEWQNNLEYDYHKLLKTESKEIELDV